MEAPKDGASAFSCTVNLAMTILGTGILAIPGGVKGAGMIWGLTFTLITGALAFFSLFLLGELLPFGGRNPTLNSIAQRSMGKFGGVITDVSLLANCFGAATSYLIIASTSIESLIGDDYPRQVYVVLCVVAVLPLCMLRRVDMLRFTSYLATFALLLLTVVVVLFALPWSETGRYHDFFNPCAGKSSDACRGAIVASTNPIDILRQFVTFTNAYTCQQGMVPICAELERPTRRRKLIVISGAIGTACVLYIAVGVAGYLTFGDLVESDILRNYPTTSPFVAAARVGMTINVVTSYPLQLFFSRISLVSLLAACGLGQHPACTRSCCPKSRSAARDRLWRARIGPGSEGIARRGGSGAGGDSGALTAGTAPPGGACGCGTIFLSEPLPVISAAIFIVTTTGIALIVDDLGVVVNLTGATGATLIGYVAPGIIFTLMAKDGGGIGNRAARTAGTGTTGTGTGAGAGTTSTSACAPGSTDIAADSSINERLIDPVAAEEGMDSDEPEIAIDAAVTPRVPLSHLTERLLSGSALSLFMLGCIIVPLAVTLTMTNSATR